MSAAEYEGWLNHFNEYPPLELVLPSLMAQLLHIVASIGGASNSKVTDYAPWLKPHKQEKKTSKSSESKDTSYLAAMCKGALVRMGHA